MTDESFSAGRTLTVNFMKRHDLSLRTPHIKRRTEPNDEIVAEFLQDIEVIKIGFPAERVFNIDETAWRIVNGKLKTIARRGTDSVTIESALNIEKACVTAIAACNRNGDCLPLWVLAKGKTQRCERRYRESIELKHFLASERLVIDHTENGWSDKSLMLRYLAWLRALYPRDPLCVIMDLHASHRAEEVQQFAGGLGIRIAFIPAGQTGTWQPLERRIFGSLKQRSIGMLSQQVGEMSPMDYDLCDAIKVLVRCWNDIKADEIRAAWENL